ncbi:hypothetical protein Glove_134g270 [Diversispora epigaea]|uniref:Uncharacterized protein n=1 Tax=Diversispora epigaea TaxID=1348612 RepID=A0A397J1N1_9GLOM|nr:hypothetical protein Glove_134g270 [Diversispora epigaea]
MSDSYSIEDNFEQLVLHLLFSANAVVSRSKSSLGHMKAVSRAAECKHPYSLIQVNRTYEIIAFFDTKVYLAIEELISWDSTTALQLLFNTKTLMHQLDSVYLWAFFRFHPRATLEDNVVIDIICFNVGPEELVNQEVLKEIRELQNNFKKLVQENKDLKESNKDLKKSNKELHKDILTYEVQTQWSCYYYNSKNKLFYNNFQSLTKYQNTPDVPGVMTYLLSRDLSNWDSQDIPNPKMKTEKFYLPYNTTY